MTVTPQPVPADEAAANDARPSRVRTGYDWESVQIGVWQRWQDLTADAVSDADALRAATRIRLAAREHALREGLTLESRRKDHGRILDLRFSQPAGKLIDPYRAAPVS